MSKSHPIVALIGTPGAGKSKIKELFDNILHNLALKPIFIDGDGFHRLDRKERLALEATQKDKGNLPYSIEQNLIEDLECLFCEYSETGKGRHRYYIHDEVDAANFNGTVGTFTDWKAISHDTDLLFYIGLHGAVMTESVNVRQYVDLLIGLAPVINLEWIQKCYRDTHMRGYSKNKVVDMISRNITDYINYILPQLSNTDINIQRIPLIDTSNPFQMSKMPDSTETLTLIHVRNHTLLKIDFDHILDTIQGAFMTNSETLIVPSSQDRDVLEKCFMPVLSRLSC